MSLFLLINKKGRIEKYIFLISPLSPVFIASLNALCEDI
jgi:hypothetical protein